MEWMIAAFFFWILQQLAKSHPLTRIPGSRLVEEGNGRTEVVYPRLFYQDGRKKRSLEADHPLLVLRTSNDTFYIKLKPNDDLLGSSVPVYRGWNSTQNCHYHGKLLSHDNGTAAISICGSQNKMSGVIFAGKDAYVLRPLDHLQTASKPPLVTKSVPGHDEAHVISKADNKLTEYCGVDHTNIPTDLGENSIGGNRRFRRSDSKGRKVIETAVYVDFPLYRKLAVQRKQPLSELQDTVLAIINQVQLIYNYQSLKTKFKIVVVKLEILSEGKEAPDAADGDIDQYLDNFCAWQDLKNYPVSSDLHWDHALMLSGFDLHKVTLGSEKNKKVLGLAWVNGMCRPKSSCTLNEGSSFEAAFVIAHEMGHSLGMMHDGPGNECDPTSFIMSDRTGPGRITWSSCSNDYLDKFFQKGYGSCLDDDNSFKLEGATYEFEDVLPGQRFDVEEQCKLSLGEEFTPYVVPKSPFNDVCRELWCVSRLWASIAHPALEGSTCGSGKQCIQGKCKSVTAAVTPTSNAEIVEDMKSAVAEFLEKLKTAFHLLAT